MKYFSNKTLVMPSIHELFNDSLGCKNTNVNDFQCYAVNDLVFQICPGQRIYRRFHQPHFHWSDFVKKYNSCTIKILQNRDPNSHLSANTKRFYLQFGNTALRLLAFPFKPTSSGLIKYHAKN